MGPPASAAVLPAETARPHRGTPSISLGRDTRDGCQNRQSHQSLGWQHRGLIGAGLLLTAPGGRQKLPLLPWQGYGTRLRGERKWLPDTENSLGR